MSGLALFVAVFLACAVEAVEATTIVLAAGTARNWRSALTGVVLALVALTIIVGIAGPAVQLLPLGILRVVVGGLLLVFGLQWIRKAVLRASGFKALHDETLIFQTNLAQARAAEQRSAFGVTDWYAFTLSFKGVLLEGLEVAFIVITFGSNQHQVGLAALAAAAAIVLVVLIGIAVRAPLSRVPENTLKLVVGIMLTSFGVFWGAEGAGATWPGADLALLVIAATIALVALGLIQLLRTRRRTRSEPRRETTPDAADSPSVEPAPTPAPPQRRPRPVVDRLRSFGLFWYDFVVGDDWLVAVGVVAAFVVTAVLSTAGAPSWWLVPVAVVVLLPVSLWRAVRPELVSSRPA